MADIIGTALHLVTDIAIADAKIEATAVGDTCDVDIDPGLDVGFIRLKGNKKVKIVGLVLERTH